MRNLLLYFLVLILCLNLYACEEEEEGEEIWNYSLRSPIYSSPSMDENRIIVNGLRGLIVCLDRNGSVVWNIELDEDETLLSSPLMANGRVFITSTLTKGKIYCLNLDNGDKIWEKEVSSPIVSSPALYENKIFFAGTDGTIYAFSWNGELLWSKKLEGAIYATPAIENGRLVVGSSLGKIYCIDTSTGGILWDFDAKAPIELEVCIDDNGQVYVITSSGKLYCLDLEDGIDLWEVSFSKKINTPPSYSDNKVLLLLSDGSLYAISPKGGSIIWSYKTEGGSVSSLCPTDGYIYFVDLKGKLYCLKTSNGEEKWTFDLDSFAYSSPIAKGDRLIVGTINGKVYCIKASSSQSKWPTFQGNNARTGRETE